MRRRTVLAGMGGAGLGALWAGPAHAEGFDRALFDLWVSARAGDGAPVYWVSSGTVRAYPSGELLFRMEGVDTARAHWPDRSAPLAHQYSRKTYLYLDKDAGAPLNVYQGRPVAPIAYPYQFITYELAGAAVRTMVEQGTAPRVQRIGPGESMSVRRLDDAVVFTAPVYLDFPTPAGGRYQAFENYDFFVQTARGVIEPHQLSWVRYGPLPDWAGGGPSIMHLVTWRVERFDDLPPTIRTHIATNAPLWRAPPRDLAEIRALQNPAP